MSGERPRGRGRPRRGQADRLNEELLSHALDHFLEKGFSGTTLNAITASLGMSKQTVYARYGDKLTLFRAALERAIDEWLVPLRKLHELEGDDVEQSLAAIARVIVDTLMSPTGLKLIRITNSESYRMPEIGEYTYKRGLQQIGDYVADFLRRRIFGDLRRTPDLDDLATTFLNLLSSPARLNAWGLQAEPVDVELFVQRRVQLFLHGILPAEQNERTIA
jgi:AcrR family transcriptional regulator